MILLLLYIRTLLIVNPQKLLLKDMCIRAIIKIIIDEKLNENLRWIKFDEFKAK